MKPAIEAWLRRALCDIPAVAEMVGQRIFPVRIPQREAGEPARPAITYRRTQTTRVQGMIGALGPETAVLEIRLWSTDYDQCRDLAEEICDALDGRRGQEGSFNLQRTRVLNLRDEEEAPWLADDVWMYAAVIELEIAWLYEAPNLETRS
jgi:hypothetical protein